MSIIAVDAMGGDFAPDEIILGCIESLKQGNEHTIKLFGRENLLKEKLQRFDYDRNRIEVVNAAEVIATAEAPVNAIRTKKDSSMVRALTAVKEKEAVGLVSAGNTGALLAGGQMIVGRIKGVNRAPLANLLPTKNGKNVLMLDLGANVDIKPLNILQFAVLGTIYMQKYLKLSDLPKVGIINIGAEEEKGNSLVKESFPILKECREINFVGSVEFSDVLKGDVDIAVCEAFVGNAILKTIEGTADFLLKVLKNTFMTNAKTKIGAMLVKKELKNAMKILDVSEYGGAVLLGLNGLVVKVHGNSKHSEVKNAILQAVSFDRNGINQIIEENFK